MVEQIELGFVDDLHYIYASVKAPEEIYVTTEFNEIDTLLVKGPLHKITADGKNLHVYIGNTKIATVYPMQTTIDIKLFSGHSAIKLLDFLSVIRKEHVF